MLWECRRRKLEESRLELAFLPPFEALGGLAAERPTPHQCNFQQARLVELRRLRLVHQAAHRHPLEYTLASHLLPRSARASHLSARQPSTPEPSPYSRRFLDARS